MKIDLFFKRKQGKEKKIKMSLPGKAENSILLCALISGFCSIVWCSSPQGTFGNLSTIIKGRCVEYQHFSDVGDHEDFSVDINCDELWTRFRNSFINKDICNVTEDDYNGMFELFHDSRKSDQILFWSGTKELAHEFSGVNDNYVTLEDTFAGYIADQLQWCGCAPGTSGCNATGINFHSCPKSCSDQRSFVNKPYWSRASRILAEKAVDTAYVILNGTQTGYYTAYWTGSIFGKTELPRLGQLQQVKKLVVLVALDIDRPPKEKCGEGTLVQLVEDAKRYGIPEIECQDNPIMVNGIMCAKFPRATRCKKAVQTQKQMTDVFITVLVLAIVFFITTIALVVILYLYVCRRKQFNDGHSTDQNKTASQGVGATYTNKEMITV